MSAAELGRFIGQKGSARLVASSSSRDGLLVDVVVKDARRAFGRLDFLVEPAAGSGSIWMAADAVTLD